ncbi:MAG: HisA/HisF-related TIM barrel protein [Chloroflexi bacterium]|nr:HisA/HisF-related TIM barrel protein [Chloroflexota bacterium]
MRLIPVMDLLDGVVVHAVKGERESYQPIRSVLTDMSEPQAVARAFRDRLGLTELYVADLNAIGGRDHHRAVIADLADREGMRLLVDAGTLDAESALQVLATGAAKVIIGAETLTTWDALLAIRAAIPADRLVFSLDMRAGQILSRCPELAAQSPMEALASLRRAGWHEVILLDLVRVGTGAGVDLALIAEARRRFPELALVAGGGIRDAGELGDLKAAGVDEVLLATALHRGVIGPPEIEALSRA